MTTVVHIGKNTIQTLALRFMLTNMALDMSLTRSSSDCAIVMFRFRPEIPQSQRDLFATKIKTLKHMSCVKDNRLIVGGPSITDPIARSQGYHFCLLSYHQDRKALEEYQASHEHHE